VPTPQSAITVQRWTAAAPQAPRAPTAPTGQPTAVHWCTEGTPHKCHRTDVLCGILCDTDSTLWYRCYPLPSGGHALDDDVGPGPAVGPEVRLELGREKEKAGLLMVPVLEKRSGFFMACSSRGPRCRPRPGPTRSGGTWPGAGSSPPRCSCSAAPAQQDHPEKEKKKGELRGSVGISHRDLGKRALRLTSLPVGALPRMCPACM